MPMASGSYPTPRRAKMEKLKPGSISLMTAEILKLPAIMYKPIQFEITTAPVRYFIGRSFLRRGFLLISLVLVCLALSPPAQAQLPSIFAADNPSGSVNSGGANIAYLQNTTGSDVTLTLDGNTITTKANRLNIFDRSSGTWVLRVIQDQQSQPVSPASQVTSNTFLTGLYAYYKLDEASGNA